MIRIKNLNYCYPKSKKLILKDLNVSLPMNTVTAIVGATGSGKSTFLECISGINKPTSGEIEILDYKINRKIKFKQLNEIHRDVAIVFQNSEDQMYCDTVMEEMISGFKNFDLDIEKGRERAASLCFDFKLDLDILKRDPLTLSGGQMRKVAIMSMLMLEPKVLILDEPTQGLDPRSKYEIMDLINKYVSTNKAKLIFVTHNPELIDLYADDVIMFEKGNIKYNGLKEDYYTFCLNNKLQLNLPESIKNLYLINKKINKNFTNIQEVIDYVKKN